MKKSFVICGLLLVLPFISPLAKITSSHAKSVLHPVIKEKLLASVAEGELKVTTKPAQNYLSSSKFAITMGNNVIATGSANCHFKNVWLDFHVLNKPYQFFSIRTWRDHQNHSITMSAGSYRENEDRSKFENDTINYSFPFDFELAPYFCENGKLLSSTKITDNVKGFYNKYRNTIKGYEITTNFPDTSP